MQSHGSLEILRRHMLKRTYFDNAGVVDQDVDLAKAIDNFSNSQLNLSGIEQIAFDREDLATTRDQIGLCTHQFVTIARDHRKIAAPRADMTPKHEPESAGPAGDEDNFVV